MRERNTRRRIHAPPSLAQFLQRCRNTPSPRVPVFRRLLLIGFVLGAACSEATGPKIDTALPSISAGSEHTCALDGVGTAYCWGQGASGRLGNGADTSARAPVRVAGGIRFASITAGALHTCALTPSGRAHCWGWNAFGQLGTGGDGNSTVPVAVAGNLSFTILSAGDQHTCGITTGGLVYCWGDNEIGQLGDPASVSQPCPAPVPCSQIPVPVASTLHFKSLSAGGYHTCAVTTDGKGYCWGWDWDGQVGNGYFTTDPISAPVAVTGALRFDAITAGAHHTCAVTTERLAYCWGGGPYGQLGNDSSGSYNYIPTPVAVVGGVRYTALTAGDNHTCGLAVNGGALCWGTGPLGTAVTRVSTTPVAVAGALRFEALDAGGQHQCGVSLDGPGFCWGLNSIGQLGIASSDAWRDFAAIVVFPPSEPLP